MHLSAKRSHLGSQTYLTIIAILTIIIYKLNHLFAGQALNINRYINVCFCISVFVSLHQLSICNNYPTKMMLTYIFKGYKCLFFFSVSMATDMSYLPAVTVTDKLRFAASKGQLSVVHQLVQEGASFIPDKVRIACSLIIIYYKYNNINNNTYRALNYILY